MIVMGCGILFAFDVIFVAIGHFIARFCLLVCLRVPVCVKWCAFDKFEFSKLHSGVV